MTINLSEVTTGQLRRIIAIKERIEKLQSRIDSIVDDGGEIQIPASQEVPAPARRKYHMSAAHKRKLIKALAKARKIRWAKVKAAKKKDRRSSRATRAKLAAAARARWAKVKAEGKKTL
jgi:hypothetical protein